MIKQFFKRQIKRTFLQAKLKKLSSSKKDNSVIFDGSDCFEGTFQRAIWPFLMVGQLHGAMPVIGVSSRSSSDLHFKWKSFRTIYAVIVAFILSSYSLLLLWKIITNPTYLNITNLIFYGMNTIGFISSLILSIYWPEVMRCWQIIESLSIFHHCTYKTKYMRRIRFLTSVALFLALVEHWLYVAATIHSIAVHHNNKANILTELAKDLFPQLVSQSEQLPIFVSILICYINESAVFIWNYLDIFIMIVGVGLSTHFKILNEKLERATVHIENLPTDFWMKMRIQYTKLCDLVDTVDDKISHLTMLSFFNNMFMICAQLTKSFKTLPTYFNTIYFWYSLIFLIMRTFAVSLLAARINDESLKPIRVLRAIPSHLWNEETKRFFDDILCKRVALSGILFFVTRKFILSVIGTIVTYELVLMQFNR